MAVLASSSSSSSFVIKNEVFVSFRGDTRNNFTSHLYAALCRKQIQTYRDDENVKRGDEISPALSRAIEESMISIVVFSKEYASSRWCLDELVHILKCKKERRQIVLPIFYGVDPSDIRKQKGSYGDACAAHEKGIEHDMNTVKQWRDALTAAADLSGFHLQDENEAKLIEKIVKHVLKKLNRLPQVVVDTEGFAGIDKRLQEIESLLCFGSPNPRVVGLWGVGGIGKTTLARTIFHRFSHQFENCCFLENVRENSQEFGLPRLEKELFSMLLEEKNLQSVNILVKNRLHNKMVLIVFDDIDDIMQLERLFGKGSWFGSRSKIIITTRDKQVLRKYTNKIYNVKALDSEEALQLFYLNAFEKEPSTPDYIKLSKEIVNFTGGNPLALKVLGSSFHSQTIQYWESAWSRLKIIPNGTIQKVLKISYDGLEEDQKDLFLDIACFLKGERRDFIESILDGYLARSGIEDLINKSLVTIYDDKVWMHDLIQEMGWEIVREQSAKDLGKRSRLWISQDVYDVLDNNKGTRQVEGIYFDISKMNDDLHLKPSVFNEMNNMRLLKIYHSKFSNNNTFKLYLTQGLQFLPNSLRYLCWYNYPSKSLPRDYKGQNLVELDMPCSELKQLWSGVQSLANLKRINLGYSKQLIRLPDLSRAPKLESINLECCTGLVEIPPLNFQGPFGSLTLRGCSKIKCLPKISGKITYLDLAEATVKELTSTIGSFQNLVELRLKGCQHIKTLPVLPRNIEMIDVSGTSLKQVPSSSIEGLLRLEWFYLEECKKLESLPTNIFKLMSLENLNLQGCSRLKKLTGTSCSLKGKEIRRESANSFIIEQLFGLHCEDRRWRKKIEFIPNWVYNLSCLKFLSCHNCYLKLEHLQIRLFSLFSPTWLYLYGCNIVEIPECLGLLFSLRTLDLGGNHFEKIPSSIIHLHQLEVLAINNCKKLRSLPQLPLSIRHLNASGCPSLEALSSSGYGFTFRHLSVKTQSFYTKEFWFSKCWKLKQNARSELSDFLYRVEEPMQESYHCNIRICYPGNEIPKWFSHQAEGESISIQLPENWLNSNFLGFAVGFVCPLIPAGRFRSFKYYHVQISLELHLKTKSGRIYKLSLYRYKHSLDFYPDAFVTNKEEEAEIRSSGISSDHVFIRCCRDEVPSDYGDALEATFYLRNETMKKEIGQMDYEIDRSSNWSVKRIGVGFIYGKEGFTTL